jgi:hypothetical protein
VSRLPAVIRREYLERVRSKLFLINLGGGRDRIEDTGFCNSCLRVRSNELVTIGGDADAGVFGF